MRREDALFGHYLGLFIVAVALLFIVETVRWMVAS